jgi:hypothetical protein
MKNQKKLSALFFSVLFVMFLSSFSCREIIHDPAGISTNPFTINYGNSAYLDNMGICVQFFEVLDDSRCPDLAMCVWEGKADVKLSVSMAKQNQSIITLRINGHVKESDINEHITLDALGHKFALMNLDPYPEINVKCDLSQYSALIRIIKN